MTSLPDLHPEAWEFERAAWRYFGARFDAVIRASEDGGSAPVFRGLAHIQLLPDLLVIPDDRRAFFVDAKWKSEAPTMHVWGDCRTTGIDFDKLAAYQEVERHTKLIVWMLFGHKAENEVRIARLIPWSANYPEGYRAGVGAGNDMVYWDYDRIRLYRHSYTDIMEAPEPTSSLSPGELEELAQHIEQRTLPGLER